MVILKGTMFDVLRVRSLPLVVALATASCASRQPADEKIKAGAGDKSNSEPAHVTPQEKDENKGYSFAASDEICPPLRLFKDVSDLCARGIMPLAPIGTCRRVQAEDSSGRFGVGFSTVEVAALGGVVELVERVYVDADGTDTAVVYLALRTERGYVLLSKVVNYWGEVGQPPKGEVFEGGETDLMLQVSQEMLEPDPGEIVTTTVHCSMGAGRTIRCNGECPSVAVEEARPLLDCDAVVAYSWASAAVGKDVTSDWGGYYDEQRLDLIREFLPNQGKVKRGGCSQVALVREVNVSDRLLTIVKLQSGPWVLLHDQVPLLDSEGEIRVEEGAGGVFVTSYGTAGHRRIHRLSLSSHDLEPVIPGACEGDARDPAPE